VYETLILIDPDSSITDESIEGALGMVYKDAGASKPVVSRSGPTFRITWPGFSFEVHRSQLPHVLEESKEIASQFADVRTEQPRIAQCNSRIELVGDDDPDMKYFNDYCYIVGAIEKLGIAYTFDQGSGEFMNL
jgi:hypothetical protein